VVVKEEVDWSGPDGRRPSSRMGRHIGSQATGGGRKVRAPEDAVMGNAHRPQGQGKCNRKQTAVLASGRHGKGETVR